jgi:hypothetical protein
LSMHRREGRGRKGPLNVVAQAPIRHLLSEGLTNGLVWQFTATDMASYRLKARAPELKPGSRDIPIF